ncbi:hypothetical protein [Paraburkholderia youngii]|uniref:Uncharacterized protein n=1 Tax=Paraburkholderia youngii TaxID=2782701 RepID=A0A7Y6K0E4_9BURK|nr:hypothetical protein [Paraburkholderia youngii]NUY01559.1 hypothetical protein [Paraburkholderia youngii]
MTTGQPQVVWLTRGAKEQLLAYARARNLSPEELGGDMILAELRRRRAPPVALPPLDQPTSNQHRLSTLVAGLEAQFGVGPMRQLLRKGD